MLLRRRGEFNAGRFWRWFAAEAQGLANALEALSRGESDAEWALIALGERIRRYDPDMDADAQRTLDGGCRLVISGGSGRSLAILLNAAPKLAGWRTGPRDNAADIRRAPFSILPRPSMDDASLLADIHAAV